MEKGILNIVLQNIQSAGYYYVLRKDEDTNRYSEWHSIRDSKKEVLANGKTIMYCFFFLVSCRLFLKYDRSYNFTLLNLK